MANGLIQKRIQKGIERFIKTARILVVNPYYDGLVQKRLFCSMATLSFVLSPQL
jgi:hypothetical protein